MITRRDFLKYTSFTLGASILGMPRIVLSYAPTDQRFVFVFLRGGMDGLFSVPAYGDPGFESARGNLAEASIGDQQPLKLDNMFALNHNLTNMHGMFQQKELAVFHAVASPYRERSHFDAQDLVENGTDKPHLRNEGWLNIAISSLQESGKPLGIAMGKSVPLLMQGKAKVTSWSPSTLPDPDPDIVQRLEMLYANDAQLKDVLSNAQASTKMEHTPKEQMAADGDKDGGRRLRQAFATYMQMAGTFLSNPDGPRIATIDLSGFDSHSAQMSPNGQLGQALKLLDAGIGSLKTNMADAWSKTAVLMTTEFGRTVAMNGTNGTDHGTATAAFLAGGAVKGGKVIADWPGLSASKLYQGRDLYPTTDLRSIETAILRDHLKVPESAIYTQVFPGGEKIKNLGSSLFA